MPHRRRVDARTARNIDNNRAASGQRGELGRADQARRLFGTGHAQQPAHATAATTRSPCRVRVRCVLVFGSRHGGVQCGRRRQQLHQCVWRVQHHQRAVGQPSGRATVTAAAAAAAPPRRRAADGVNLHTHPSERRGAPAPDRAQPEQERALPLQNQRRHRRWRLLGAAFERQASRRPVALPKRGVCWEKPLCGREEEGDGHLRRRREASSRGAKRRKLSA
eukprot:6909406-Prymnesium_polylepis.1